jgi:hypothetical protein
MELYKVRKEILKKIKKPVDEIWLGDKNNFWAFFKKTDMRFLVIEGDLTIGSPVREKTVSLPEFEKCLEEVKNKNFKCVWMML